MQPESWLGRGIEVGGGARPTRATADPVRALPCFVIGPTFACAGFVARRRRPKNETRVTSVISVQSPRGRIDWWRDQSELEIQEVIGGGQVAEADRVGALTDHVGGVLQDRRHAQRGGLLTELQRV